MLEHRKRRALTLGAILGAVALVAGACGGGSSDSERSSPSTSTAPASNSPIKIGVINELSGPASLATLGAATQAGIDTAIRTINASGGIGGHLLEMKVYDGQGNPSAASAAVRQAISDDPTYMLGFLSSADLAPSVAVVNASQIPWLFTATVFKEISTKYLHGLSLDGRNTGLLMLQAARRALGGSLKRKVLAVEGIAPSGVTDDKIAAIKAQAEKEGAQVVRTVRDPVTTSQWSSQAASVMSANVDAVLAMNVDSVIVTIGKALGVAGYQGAIIADPVGAAEGTFATINSPKFYALREAAPLQPGSPLYKAVETTKSSTTRANGNPVAFARGYAAGWTLIRTLQKCHVPCSRDKFLSTVKALGDLDIPNNPFFGTMNFTVDQNGNHTAQLFKWDAASKKSVSDGAPLVAK